MSTNPSLNPYEAACRDLLRRVAASTHFQRTARLRDFLTYVAEKSLADPTAEIHEPEIAEHVFGRDPGSADDTIVRVHATQLRRRLEQYFAAVPGEPIVIEIPKGNYAALFKPRAPLPGTAEMAVVRAGDAIAGGGKGPRWLVASLGAAVVLLAGGLVFVGAQNAELRGKLAAFRTPTPNVAMFWSRLIDPQRTTDIVLADAGLSLFADIVKAPPNLTEYANRAYWNRAQRFAGDPPLNTALRALMSRRYTSNGDANVLTAIAGAYGIENGRVTAVFARDFQPRSLVANHLIFIGSKRSNPWVELFESRFNFRAGFEESVSGYFDNRNPEPGEQPVYRPETRPGQLPDSYCHIAFFPIAGGTGNALCLEGTEMEATEAGGGFLTRELSLLELRRQLKVDEGRSFPFFEILLRTSRLGGAAPEAHIVAARVLKP